MHPQERRERSAAVPAMLHPNGIIDETSSDAPPPQLPLVRPLASVSPEHSDRTSETNAGNASGLFCL